MQRVRFVTSLALLVLGSVLAVGQTQLGKIPPTQTASTIKGIKIMESGFDSETKTLKLVFMNDRAADITAYHYCFKVISTDPKQTIEQCQLLDALTTVLEMQADKKARPWLPEITFLGPGQNFVHPGEKRKVEEPIGYNDTIYNGSIYVDEVAWSDDTFEGTGQLISTERSAELKEREFVSRTIKHALSSGTGPMLVVSVISTLRGSLQQELRHRDDCDSCAEKKIYVLMDAILHVEQPKRHMGDTRKFIPDNQSEFLNQFLVRHDSFSEEIGKHVSLRKADEQ